MTAFLFNMPWSQVFDGSGNTLAGAKLYFYDAGTTTLKNIYADSDLTVAQSNPVIADAGGRFAPIYIDDQPFKVVLYNASDNLIWSADNVINQSVAASVQFALDAINKTMTSAGYSGAALTDSDNFPKAIFQYGNEGNWYSETGESDNIYELTGLGTYSKPDSYFEGMSCWFVCIRQNTGSATVNIESMGQENILRADGSALQAGDVAGLVHLVYNGSYFVLQGQKSVGSYGDETINGKKTFNTSPVVPTPANNDNSTKVANTAWVRARVKSIIPDWSHAISMSFPYTAPSDGWINLQISKNGSNCYITIDGVNMARTRGDYGDYEDSCSVQCPVAKGAVIDVTNSPTVDIKLFAALS